MAGGPPGIVARLRRVFIALACTAPASRLRRRPGRAVLGRRGGRLRPAGLGWWLTEALLARPLDRLARDLRVAARDDPRHSPHGRASAGPSRLGVAGVAVQARLAAAEAERDRRARRRHRAHRGAEAPARSDPARPVRGRDRLRPRPPGAAVQPVGRRSGRRPARARPRPPGRRRCCRARRWCTIWSGWSAAPRPRPGTFCLRHRRRRARCCTPAWRCWPGPAPTASGYVLTPVGRQRRPRPRRPARPPAAHRHRAPVAACSPACARRWRRWPTCPSCPPRSAAPSSAC